MSGKKDGFHEKCTNVRERESERGFCPGVNRTPYRLVGIESLFLLKQKPSRCGMAGFPRTGHFEGFSLKKLLPLFMDLNEYHSKQPAKQRGGKQKTQTSRFRMEHVCSSRGQNAQSRPSFCDDEGTSWVPRTLALITVIEKDSPWTAVYPGYGKALISSFSNMAIHLQQFLVPLEDIMPYSHTVWCPAGAGRGCRGPVSLGLLRNGPVAVLVAGEDSRWPGASLACDCSPGDPLSPFHREQEETSDWSYQTLRASCFLPGLTCDTECGWQNGGGVGARGGMFRRGAQVTLRRDEQNRKQHTVTDKYRQTEVL
ncbi:hypothetical protein MHYP_G00211340 [Metynnis hypsauchen]